jgi:outer membrane protein assembly factor BamD (BamD/ComL family)
VQSAGAVPSAPEERGVSVVAEAHLLRDAEAALRAGDVGRATALLEEHARVFPHGVLVEERDAERVLVLCAAGQVDTARTEAQRFFEAHPESPLARRVRASCALQ